MKSELIKLIKPLVKNIILTKRLLVEELPWFIRCVKYNNWSDDKDTDLYTLLIISHVLEKGLTMPRRRLGFGYDRVREVLAHCRKCIENYGADNVEIQAALNDLGEYNSVHKSEGFDLPSDIQQGLDEILQFHSVSREDKSLQFSKENFFCGYRNFTEFAKSRHTCRHYSEDPVELSTIEECIKIAQTAPSACNRQGTKVYILASENAKKVVRKYQNGSRGFGEYADKFILITADQHAWDIRQIKSGFIDAGIFTMNLLYAFHEKHIAACTLNAHLSSKQLRSFYKELPIKQNEVPVLFLSIGYPPESFTVAKSTRKKVNDIITVL